VTVLDSRRSEASSSVVLTPMVFQSSAGREVGRPRPRTEQLIRPHSLPRPVAIVDRESERWFSFLEALVNRVAAGDVTAVQRDALVGTWDEARRRQPALRRPAVGSSKDGVLQVSWSFHEGPERVFTLDIDRDGGIEWFYRDAQTGLLRGSGDEPVRMLPDEALDLLTSGFSAVASKAR